MTDLTALTPGERLALNDPDTDRVKDPAVFIGIDRGYAVVAVPTNYVNPFWVDIDGEQPHLRRASWKARRVRAATVHSTWADYQAELDAERAELITKREADEAYEADRLAAARELVKVLDQVEGTLAYTHQTGVYIGGGPDKIRAVTALVLKGLEVAA